MPTACLTSFPEFELFQCYGCHFSQPKTLFENGELKTDDKGRTNTPYKYVINICENFAQRWYGQNDLFSATKKFDDCGLTVDGEVIIPSVKYFDAETLMNKLAPHFFNTGEYYF